MNQSDAVPVAVMYNCKTCQHWTPCAPTGEKPIGFIGRSDGGICECPKIRENMDGKYEADALVYPYPEGADFWTGPDFGCVHHQPLTNELTEDGHLAQANPQ